MTFPYYKFRFDPPPPPYNSNPATTLLIEAQNLHINGEYRKAADLLITLVEQDDLARQPLLDCLVQLRDTSTVIEVFDPPTNEAEAIHLMDALWEEGNRERLSEIMDNPPIVNSTDPSVVEIRRKYGAKLK